MTGQRQLLLPVLVSIASVFIWLWGVDLPHVGIYNANSNYLALASKNYLRFGYDKLHFLPTYFAGANLPEQIPYYLHHPVAVFLFASLGFRLFGDGNWVVHIVPFISQILSVFILYRIVLLVSGKMTAWWTVALAMSVPMVTFFWKYMFFEQTSMLFVLSGVYFMLRYRASMAKRHLLGIVISGLAASLTDWYAGYLIFPLLYLRIRLKEQGILSALVAWSLAVMVGIGGFLIVIFLAKGSMADMVSAFLSRSATSELWGVSWWPVRYPAMLAVRSIVYYSPLLLFFVAYAVRHLRAGAKKESAILLTIFGIMGLVNIVILPTATWGHGYFLYFLYPFVAYAGGLWLSGLAKSGRFHAAGVLFLVLLWSVMVTNFKLAQVRKQVWKYERSHEIAQRIPVYSIVGAIGYPGDVLEQYHFLQTAPLFPEDVDAWVAGDIVPGSRFAVFACDGSCRDDEYAMVARVSSRIAVDTLGASPQQVWLLDRESPPAPAKEGGTDISEGADGIVPHAGTVVRAYRWIRDMLGGMQI